MEIREVDESGNHTPHKADKPMVKVQGSYLPESDNGVVLIQATGINNW